MIMVQFSTVCRSNKKSSKELLQALEEAGLQKQRFSIAINFFWNVLLFDVLLVMFTFFYIFCVYIVVVFISCFLIFFH